MSKYYEDGKPFRKDDWNKLIKDLNKLYSFDSEDCPAIELIEEVDDHVWTLKDVKDIRDTLHEECEANFANPEDYYDLKKPWHHDIIDEIARSLQRCNCGITVIDEANLSHRMVCPGCGYADFDQLGPTVGSVYGGMQVGVEGIKLRTWQYGEKDVEGGDHDFAVYASGPVSCEGTVEDNTFGPGFEVQTRQTAIKHRLTGPSCRGDIPCVGPIWGIYAADIAAIPEDIIQFRIVHEVIEYEDCDE